MLERLESRVVPATILVTSLLDAGHGTLRAAIEKANQHPQHSGGQTHSDTIKFSPSVRGTIVLESPLPVLLTHIVISGPGPSSLTVARSGAPVTQEFRIFTVGTGARIAMTGLTITGGSGAEGAGINNAGSLTLKNMWIVGNSAVEPGFTQGPTVGGGVDNTGTLSVTDSRFDDNSATGTSGGLFGGMAYGGGIANSGRLSITGGAFVSNSATGGEGSLFGGGGYADGGGIENTGPGRMSVTGHTEFIGNSALASIGGGGEALGGAIDNSSILSITQATFSFNSATGGSQGSTIFGEAYGGAIESTGTGPISRSTFNGNSATGDTAYGGAIDFIFGTLSVTDSTFSGNVARSESDSLGDSFGGGIYNVGTLSVTGSTFSGNLATNGYDGYGGGIDNDGTLSVTNSTFNGNSAAGTHGNFGGGIADGGIMSLTYVTADDNSAATGGGVAINFDSTAAGSSIDSIFQNSQGGNVSVVAGSFRSLGHNLFSDDPNVSLDPTDLVNTDPLLSPLESNGGLTQTQALLPGSPAINKGISIKGITTDQRARPRPRHGSTDIGAFQVQPTLFVKSIREFDFPHRPPGLGAGPQHAARRLWS